MKYLLILIPVLAIGAFLLWRNETPENDSNPSKVEETKEIDTTPTNFTAEFNIVTNGTTRIFTDPKYHNQSEDLFLEKQNPNTIVVKRPNVTWSDFFNTLPMSLTPDCLTTGTNQTFCTGSNGTLRFYLNDIETPDALEKEISPNDNLEVIYEN